MPAKHAQHGRFAGAVVADDAELIAVIDLSATHCRARARRRALPVPFCRAATRRRHAPEQRIAQARLTSVDRKVGDHVLEDNLSQTRIRETKASRQCDGETCSSLEWSAPSRAIVTSSDNDPMQRRRRLAQQRVANDRDQMIERIVVRQRSPCARSIDPATRKSASETAKSAADVPTSCWMSR